jgi:hypothetical protein
MAVFWLVPPCSVIKIYRRLRLIALVMAAAGTSETSVIFYQTTRRNNPEDGRHIRCKVALIFTLVPVKRHFTRWG